MRLICPNCDAQYEVDDSAIPDSGRDVQCSACGHAWFQLPPDLVPDEEDPEPALAMAPPPAPEPEAPAEAEEAAPAPPRRALDDALVTLLREEAEREAAARRAEEPRGVETQPDLGLATPAPPPKPPVTDLSAPAPAEAEAEAEAEPETATDRPVTQRPSPRRDLLPDIEVINSTLRAGSEAREAPDPTDDAAPAAARRGGFRTGFIAMVAAAALLALAYVLAPRIAALVPAAEPAMAAYVRGVDAARLWLDRHLQAAASALRGFSGEDGGSGSGS